MELYMINYNNQLNLYGFTKKRRQNSLFRLLLIFFLVITEFVYTNFAF